MTDAERLDAYDLIPKVELHCHVEGSVRPSTVVELARKAGRPLPVEDPAELYSYEPAAGPDLVEQLGTLRRSGRADRAIGVGADSTELGVDLSAFAPAYEAATRLGLRRTCHAGEAVGVGPDNIRVALDILGAERIDHGVAVVEDPELVHQLAGQPIPLTVCPTSNVEGIASAWLDESDRTALTDEFNAVLRSLDPPGV